jgi:hypothetical protein
VRRIEDLADGDNIRNPETVLFGGVGRNPNPTRAARIEPRFQVSLAAGYVPLGGNRLSPLTISPIMPAESEQCPRIAAQTPSPAERI